MKPRFIFPLLAGLLCLLCTVPSAAQDLRLAYFGETITHYGIKAGLDFSLSRRTQQVLPTREWYVSPGLTVYRHPHHHVGVIVSPEFGWRRTGRRGGQLEIAAAPSLFRYFLAGKTYQVGDDGQFERVPLAGEFAFLPTFSIGFGKDLSVRRDIPLAWYTRVHLMRQYPHNAGALTRFALEVGIRKPLNH